MNKFTVVSSYGWLDVDSLSGEIKNRYAKYEDDTYITLIEKFDVEEYENYYGYHPTGDIDILFIGFWDKDGVYFGPEKEFRK